jgi:hypothetical protein
MFFAPVSLLPPIGIYRVYPSRSEGRKNFVSGKFEANLLLTCPSLEALDRCAGFLLLCSGLLLCTGFLWAGLAPFTGLFSACFGELGLVH